MHGWYGYLILLDPDPYPKPMPTHLDERNSHEKDMGYVRVHEVVAVG